jgi:hypothetical protein
MNSLEDYKPLKMADKNAPWPNQGLTKKDVIPPPIKKDKEDDEKKKKELDIGPLQEYKDPETRLEAIKNADIDRGLKMMYQWIRNGAIDFDEFETLLVEVFIKTYEET